MTFGEAAKTSARRRPAREESDDIEAPEEAPLPCDPCDPEDTLEEGTASVEDEKGGGSSLVTSLVMSVAVKKLQRKKIEQETAFAFVNKIFAETDLLKSGSIVIRRAKIKGLQAQGTQSVKKAPVTGKEKLPFLIFHPYTSWRLGWDFALALIILQTCFTVPIRVAFPDEPSGCNRSFIGQETMWYADVVLDLIFSLDVLLNFRTAYIRPVKRPVGKDFETPNRQSGFALLTAEDPLTDKPEDGVKLASKSGTEEEIITDWKRIALRYVRGFFWLDVVAAIPMELILLAFPCPQRSKDGINEGDGSIEQLVRGSSLLKLLRLARVVRLFKIDRMKEIMMIARDRLRLHPGRIRLLKFALIISLCMHWNACIWAMISNMAIQASKDSGWQYMYGDFEEGASVCSSRLSFSTEFTAWTQADDDGDGPLPERIRERCFHEMKWTHKWLISLYWALTTMTTIGYGDVIPYNVWEAGFNIMALFEAGFAFSFFIGNIAMLLRRTNLKKMKHTDAEELWESFIYRERVPKALADSIRAHLMENFKNPVVDLPRFAREKLSTTLLKDITGHLYFKVLERLAIFRDVDQNVLVELALSLRPMQLAPEAVVFKEGEEGQCMYFLARGEIELCMMLVSSARKQEMGLQVVQDIAVDNIDARRNPIQYERVTINEDGHIDRIPCMPLVYRWYIHEESSISYFGENVLYSTNSVRLSSAKARKWSVVYRLDREALKLSAKKNPSMHNVYRKLRAKKQTRLMRAIRTTLDTLRARYNNVLRLLVKVECAQRLPRTDGILGLSDPYVKVQLGDPEPPGIWKQYQTQVQNNTLDPVWNEAFWFPISKQLVDEVMRDRNEPGLTRPKYPLLNFRVFDHDQFGDDDEVGYANLDLRNFFFKVFGTSEQSDKTQNFETQWVTLLQTNHKGEIVEVHNAKHGEPAAALRVTVQLFVPEAEDCDAQTETAEKSKLSAIDSSKALADEKISTSLQFPPPCPPSNPPSPEPTPRTVHRFALDAKRKDLPFPRTGNALRGSSSTAISRKALNPPPAYDVDSLLVGVDVATSRGDLITSANTTPPKYNPTRHQDSDISGYSNSDSDDAGDVNTYERVSSFDSDGFFERHQPAVPRAMGLSEGVKSEPILRSESSNELMLLLAHISEETGQGVRLDRDKGPKARSRGPIEIEQDNAKEPSAPSGPNPGTAASQLSSWNSTASLVESSAGSENDPKESDSLKESAGIFVPDSAEEARKAITLLLRTIDAMKREREADMAEQTAKMYVIEQDMELVSKAFSDQRLQIQTLKMENDQLRAQVSSARSAPSQEASNATKGLELSPVYMFNTQDCHYQLAERLAKRLIDQDIDLNTLLELGPADFERLGVLKVGWQKKLVRKARESLAASAGIGDG